MPDGKRSLLVVDDNSADISLLRMALAKADFDCDITVINDGAEALAFLLRPQASAGHSSFDLIVLDMHLPKVDGLEILAALNENSTFANVPVAVLSGRPPHGELAKLQRYPRVSYLAKPSSLDGFLKIGERLKELTLEGTARPG